MSTDLTVPITAALCGSLEKLRDEVVAIACSIPEPALWAKPVDPGNSIGHLILHLTGNLNHFVGAQLGGSGYVRQREREFTETNPLDRDRLLADLDTAVKQFRRIVSALSADQLAAAHPEARFGTVLQTLLHVLTHFALHRGQMTYIARLTSPK